MLAGSQFRKEPEQECLVDQLLLLAVGFINFCVSLCITGYNAYSGNRSIQLALVNLLRDGSLYPNDPVRETLYRYASLLWWLVAHVPANLPLDRVELVLFLLVRALLIYAVYRLARVLFPGSLLAPIGSMAIFGLVPQPLIAEGTIMPNIFEQTGTTIPSILLATADFLSRRYWMSALWTSVAFSLTPVYGSYLLFYLAPIALLHPVYRKEWKLWGRALLLLFVLCLPAALLAMKSQNVSQFDITTWYIVQRVRSPHHLFPLSFPLNDWAMYILMLVVATGSALVLDNKDSLRRQVAGTWLIVCLLFVLIAFIAAYIVQSRLLLVWQTARATDVWLCLMSILSVGVVGERIEEHLFGRTVMSRAGFALCCLWFALLINLWSIGPHPKASLVFAASITGIGWLVTAKQNSSGKTATRILSTVVGLCLILVAGRVFVSSPPGLSLFHDSPVYPFAQWAGKSTSKEALFLIPPGDEDAWPSFRALSQRNVFVTWKDGTNVFFSPSYASVWVDRMKALGVDIMNMRLGLTERPSVDGSNINQIYDRLDDTSVQQLAERYKIDYWVLRRDKPTRFPVVFQHGKWKVVQLRTDKGVSFTTPTSHPNRESQR